jgi:hypothetical protein
MILATTFLLMAQHRKFSTQNNQLDVPDELLKAIGLNEE